MGSFTTNNYGYKPALGDEETGTGYVTNFNTAADNMDAALKTAYDHSSSSGSDHSFINQNVTNTAAPTFASFNITPASSGYQTCVQSSYSATNFEGSYYAFRRYGGTVSSPSIVGGDSYTLGAIDFFGYDGSTLKRSAQIAAFTDGTPSSGLVPGKIQFSTTDSAGATNWVLRLGADKEAQLAGGLTVAGVLVNKGVNWTLRSSAADNGWWSVCYGNGMFVAVAYSGAGNRVMTSPDGVKWTLRSSAVDNNWGSVCYGKGMFVAVAISGTGNRVMTSGATESFPPDTNIYKYVRLGDNGPYVKNKKYSLTTSGSQGGQSTLALSVTTSNKIVSITALADKSWGRVKEGFSKPGAGLEYYVYPNSSNQIVVENSPANSGNILSVPVTVYIVYEE